MARTSQLVTDELDGTSLYILELRNVNSQFVAASCSSHPLEAARIRYRRNHVKPTWKLLNQEKSSHLHSLHGHGIANSKLWFGQERNHIRWNNKISKKILRRLIIGHRSISLEGIQESVTHSHSLFNFKANYKCARLQLPTAGRVVKVKWKGKGNDDEEKSVRKVMTNENACTIR